LKVLQFLGLSKIKNTWATESDHPWSFAGLVDQ